MKEKWRALTLEDRPLGARAALVATSAGLLCFTLFIFAPIDIYLSNAGEFWFRLSQFWWLMALVGLAVFAAAFGLGLLLKGTLLDVYVTLLFAAAVVLYLQGNFLNLSYGELNGEQVDWSRYGGYAILNTLLTTVLFFIPCLILYFNKRLWRGMLRFVSFLIVAVQLVAMGAGLMLRGKPEQSGMALGWTGVRNYSDEQNLVILIVDALDEPYFTEYLDAHPELAPSLDGFTYYPNTAGISMSTFFSMTPLLTGRVFNYDPADYDAYLDEAWDHATLFTKLKAADYDVRALCPQEVYIGAVRDELFDNYVVGERGISDYGKFTRMMLELVCYTYLPHVYKAGFWLYPGEFNYLQDRAFYTDDDVETHRHLHDEPINATSAQKTFRMYHLNAMHEPFTLTAEAGRLPDGAPTSPMEQAEGSFHIVNMLLDQMRDAGVYDASAIVIAADHSSIAHIDGARLDSPVYSPTLLYKPMGAHGSMLVSDAPASIMDIRATLLDAAGLDHSQEGPSLTELALGQNRTRFFYRPLGKPYVFYEYTIGDADANDFSNWTATGAVYTPPDGARRDSPDGE